jgi:hypothetical protein
VGGCEQEVAVSDIGDFVVTRTPAGYRVDKADRLIAVSRELLSDHDPSLMHVDGERLTLLGDYRYLATGDTHYGHPVYRRVMNEGDL